MSFINLIEERIRDITYMGRTSPLYAFPARGFGPTFFRPCTSCSLESCTSNNLHEGQHRYRITAWIADDENELIWAGLHYTNSSGQITFALKPVILTSPGCRWLFSSTHPSCPQSARPSNFVQPQALAVPSKSESDQQIQKQGSRTLANSPQEQDTGQHREAWQRTRASHYLRDVPVESARRRWD